MQGDALDSTFKDLLRPSAVPQSRIMGSWDCYCAICGGPFGSAQVSRKPRTTRFRRRQKRWEKYNPEEEAHDNDADNEDEDEGEDDNGSLGSFEEEHSYDPDIVSKEDTQWTNVLHILGVNVNAPGVSKLAFSNPPR